MQGSSSNHVEKFGKDKRNAKNELGSGRKDNRKINKVKRGKNREEQFDFTE